MFGCVWPGRGGVWLWLRVVLAATVRFLDAVDWTGWVPVEEER